MREAETVGAPKKPVRESRSLERFGSYIALVTNISKKHPSKEKTKTKNKEDTNETNGGDYKTR